MLFVSFIFAAVGVWQSAVVVGSEIVAFPLLSGSVSPWNASLLVPSVPAWELGEEDVVYSLDPFGNDASRSYLPLVVSGLVDSGGIGPVTVRIGEKECGAVETEPEVLYCVSPPPGESCSLVEVVVEWPGGIASSVLRYECLRSRPIRPFSGNISFKAFSGSRVASWAGKTGLDGIIGLDVLVGVGVDGWVWWGVVGGGEDVIRLWQWRGECGGNGIEGEGNSACELSVAWAGWNRGVLVGAPNANGGMGGLWMVEVERGEILEEQVMGVVVKSVKEVTGFERWGDGELRGVGSSVQWIGEMDDDGWDGEVVVGAKNSFEGKGAVLFCWVGLDWMIHRVEVAQVDSFSNSFYNEMGLGWSVAGIGEAGEDVEIDEIRMGNTLSGAPLTEQEAGAVFLIEPQFDAGFWNSPPTPTFLNRLEVRKVRFTTEFEPGDRMGLALTFAPGLEGERGNRVAFFLLGSKRAFLVWIASSGNSEREVELFPGTAGIPPLFPFPSTLSGIPFIGDIDGNFRPEFFLLSPSPTQTPIAITIRDFAASTPKTALVLGVRRQGSVVLPNPGALVALPLLPPEGSMNWDTEFVVMAQYTTTPTSFSASVDSVDCLGASLTNVSSNIYHVGIKCPILSGRPYHYISLRRKNSLFIHLTFPSPHGVGNIGNVAESYSLIRTPQPLANVFKAQLLSNSSSSPRTPQQNHHLLDATWAAGTLVSKTFPVIRNLSTWITMTTPPSFTHLTLHTYPTQLSATPTASTNLSSTPFSPSPHPLISHVSSLFLGVSESGKMKWEDGGGKMLVGVPGAKNGTGVVVMVVVDGSGVVVDEEILGWGEEVGDWFGASLAHFPQGTVDAIPGSDQVLIGAPGRDRLEYLVITGGRVLSRGVAYDATEPTGSVQVTVDAGSLFASSIALISSPNDRPRVPLFLVGAPNYANESGTVFFMTVATETSPDTRMYPSFMEELVQGGSGFPYIGGKHFGRAISQSPTLLGSVDLFHAIISSSTLVLPVIGVMSRIGITAYTFPTPLNTTGSLRFAGDVDGDFVSDFMMVEAGGGGKGVEGVRQGSWSPWLMNDVVSYTLTKGSIDVQWPTYDAPLSAVYLPYIYSPRMFAPSTTSSFIASISTALFMKAEELLVRDEFHSSILQVSLGGDDITKSCDVVPILASSTNRRSRLRRNVQCSLPSVLSAGFGKSTLELEITLSIPIPRLPPINPHTVTVFSYAHIPITPFSSSLLPLPVEITSPLIAPITSLAYFGIPSAFQPSTKPLRKILVGGMGGVELVHLGVDGTVRDRADIMQGVVCRSIVRIGPTRIYYDLLNTFAVGVPSADGGAGEVVLLTLSWDGSEIERTFTLRRKESPVIPAVEWSIDAEFGFAVEGGSRYSNNIFFVGAPGDDEDTGMIYRITFHSTTGDPSGVSKLVLPISIPNGARYGAAISSFANERPSTFSVAYRNDIVAGAPAWNSTTTSSSSSPPSTATGAIIVVIGADSTFPQPVVPIVPGVHPSVPLSMLPDGGGFGAAVTNVGNVDASSNYFQQFFVAACPPSSSSCSIFHLQLDNTVVQSLTLISKHPSSSMHLVMMDAGDWDGDGRVEEWVGNSTRIILHQLSFAAPTSSTPPPLPPSPFPSISSPITSAVYVAASPATQNTSSTAVAIKWPSFPKGAGGVPFGGLPRVAPQGAADASILFRIVFPNKNFVAGLLDGTPSTPVALAIDDQYCRSAAIIPWPEAIDPDHSFAVECQGVPFSDAGGIPSLELRTFNTNNFTTVTSSTKISDKTIQVERERLATDSYFTRGQSRILSGASSLKHLAMSQVGDLSGDGFGPDLVLTSRGIVTGWALYVKSPNVRWKPGTSPAYISRSLVDFNTNEYVIGSDTLDTVRIGESIAFLGDLDLDGFAGEIIVGAPEDNSVVIFWLSKGGQPLKDALIKFSHIANSQEGARFGESILALGDLTSSGNYFVAIGAPHFVPSEDTQNVQEGAVVIVSITTEGELGYGLILSPTAAALFQTFTGPNVHFGSSLAYMNHNEGNTAMNGFLVVGAPGKSYVNPVGLSASGGSFVTPILESSGITASFLESSVNIQLSAAEIWPTTMTSTDLKNDGTVTEVVTATSEGRIIVLVYYNGATLMNAFEIPKVDPMLEWKGLGTLVSDWMKDMIFVQDSDGDSLYELLILGESESHDIVPVQSLSRDPWHFPVSRTYASFFPTFPFTSEDKLEDVVDGLMVLPSYSPFNFDDPIYTPNPFPYFPLFPSPDTRFVVGMRSWGVSFPQEMLDEFELFLGDWPCGSTVKAKNWPRNWGAGDEGHVAIVGLVCRGLPEGIARSSVPLSVSTSATSLGKTLYKTNSRITPSTASSYATWNTHVAYEDNAHLFKVGPNSVASQHVNWFGFDSIRAIDWLDDVDGDGHAEIVYSLEVAEYTSVYVANVFMDGSSDAASGNGKVVATSTIANSNFGSAIAGLGDLDGDGKGTEIVVSTPDEGSGMLTVVWIALPLGTPPNRTVTHELASLLPMQVESHCGHSLLSLGVIDPSTLLTAVVVGCPDLASPGKGGILVLLLRPDAAIAISTYTTGSLYGLTLGGFDSFGTSLARFGYGVEGKHMFLVGAPLGKKRHFSNVVDGTPGAVLALNLELDPAFSSISLSYLGTWSGDGGDVGGMPCGIPVGILNDIAKFGEDIVSLGDVDGDGLEFELIVTAPTLGEYFLIFARADDPNSPTQLFVRRMVPLKETFVFAGTVPILFSPPFYFNEGAVDVTEMDTLPSLRFYGFTSASISRIGTISIPKLPPPSKGIVTILTTSTYPSPFHAPQTTTFPAHLPNTPILLNPKGGENITMRARVEIPTIYHDVVSISSVTVAGRPCGSTFLSPPSPPYIFSFLIHCNNTPRGVPGRQAPIEVVLEAQIPSNIAAEGYKVTRTATTPAKLIQYAKRRDATVGETASRLVYDGVDGLGEFGSAVAWVGDLLGKGGEANDVAIGAPGHNSNRGLVVLYFNLQPNGAFDAIDTIPGANDAVSLSLPSDTRFGTSIAFLGDLDNDGIAAELCVGGTGPDSGAIWILWLRPNRDFEATNPMSLVRAEEHSCVACVEFGAAITFYRFSQLHQAAELFVVGSLGGMKIYDVSILLQDGGDDDEESGVVTFLAPEIQVDSPLCLVSYTGLTILSQIPDPSNENPNDYLVAVGRPNPSTSVLHVIRLNPGTRVHNIIRNGCGIGDTNTYFQRDIHSVTNVFGMDGIGGTSWLALGLPFFPPRSDSQSGRMGLVGLKVESDSADMKTVEFYGRGVGMDETRFTTPTFTDDEELMGLGIAWVSKASGDVGGGMWVFGGKNVVWVAEAKPKGGLNVNLFQIRTRMGLEELGFPCIPSTPHSTPCPPVPTIATASAASNYSLPIAFRVEVFSNFVDAFDNLLLIDLTVLHVSSGKVSKCLEVERVYAAGGGDEEDKGSVLRLNCRGLLVNQELISSASDRSINIGNPVVVYLVPWNAYEYTDDIGPATRFKKSTPQSYRSSTEVRVDRQAAEFAPKILSSHPVASSPPFTPFTTTIVVDSFLSILFNPPQFPSIPVTDPNTVGFMVSRKSPAVGRADATKIKFQTVPGSTSIGWVTEATVDSFGCLPNAPLEVGAYSVTIAESTSAPHYIGSTSQHTLTATSPSPLSLNPLGGTLFYVDGVGFGRYNLSTIFTQGKTPHLECGIVWGSAGFFGSVPIERPKEFSNVSYIPFWVFVGHRPCESAWWVNETRVACVAPAGIGSDLPVSVVVFGAVAVLPSSQPKPSYSNLPSISSITTPDVLIPVEGTLANLSSPSFSIAETLPLHVISASLSRPLASIPISLSTTNFTFSEDTLYHFPIPSGGGVGWEVSICFQDISSTSIQSRDWIESLGTKHNNINNPTIPDTPYTACTSTSPTPTASFSYAPVVIEAISPSIDIDATGGKTLTLTVSSIPSDSALQRLGIVPEITLGERDKCTAIQRASLESTSTTLSCILPKLSDGGSSVAVVMSVGGSVSAPIRVSVLRVSILGISPFTVVPAASGQLMYNFSVNVLGISRIKTVFIGGKACPVQVSDRIDTITCAFYPAPARWSTEEAWLYVTDRGTTQISRRSFLRAQPPPEIFGLESSNGLSTGGDSEVGLLGHGFGNVPSDFLAIAIGFDAEEEAIATVQAALAASDTPQLPTTVSPSKSIIFSKHFTWMSSSRILFRLPRGVGSDIAIRAITSSFLVSPARSFSYDPPLATTTIPAVILPGLYHAQIYLCGKNMIPEDFSKSNVSLRISIGGIQCSDSLPINSSCVLCFLTTPTVDDWPEEDGVEVEVAGISSGVLRGVTQLVPPPSITSISPEVAGPGDVVTIVGRGFGSSIGDIAHVQVEGEDCSALRWVGPTEIRCTIPNPHPVWSTAGDRVIQSVDIVLALKSGLETNPAQLIPRDLRLRPNPWIRVEGLASWRGLGEGATVVVRWRYLTVDVESVELDARARDGGVVRAAPVTRFRVQVLTNDNTTVLAGVVTDRETSIASEGLSHNLHQTRVATSERAGVLVRIRAENDDGATHWEYVMEWGAPYPDFLGSLVAESCLQSQYLATQHTDPSKVVCEECPVGGVCNGLPAQNMTAEEGYWRVPWAPYELGFARCSAINHCIGLSASTSFPDPLALTHVSSVTTTSNSTIIPSSSSDLSYPATASLVEKWEVQDAIARETAVPGAMESSEGCRAGHWGPLCSNCKENYFPSVDRSCVQCGAFAWALARVILLLVGGSVMLSMVLIRAWRMRASTRSREVSVIKSVVNHLQVIMIISTVRLRWPGLAAGFFTAAEVVSSASTSGLTAECLLGSQSNNPYVRTSLVLSGPIWLLLLAALLWGIVGWAELRWPWIGRLLMAPKEAGAKSPSPSPTSSKSPFFAGPDAAGSGGRGGGNGGGGRKGRRRASLFVATGGAAEENEWSVLRGRAEELQRMHELQRLSARRRGGGAFGDKGGGEDKARRMSLPLQASISKPSGPLSSRSIVPSALHPMKRFATRMLVSAIVIAFIVHTPITSAAFKLLTCRPIHPEDNPNASQLRLDMDLSIACDDPQHRAWLLAMALPMLFLFSIGVPVGIAGGLAYIGPVNLALPVWRERLSFVYGGFRAKFYFWEAIVLAKKVAIAGVASALAPLGPGVQLASALIVVLGSQILHGRAQPYSIKILNVLESVAQGTAALSLVCGILIVIDDLNVIHGLQNGTVATIASVVILVVNCLFLLAAAMILSARGRQWIDLAYNWILEQDKIMKQRLAGPSQQTSGPLNVGPQQMIVHSNPMHTHGRRRSSKKK